MTKARRETVDELMRRLITDPDYLRLREAQEQERLRKKLAWARAEAPLVEELQALGVEVSSVWDLVNTSNSYDQALPLLSSHLRRDYPDRVLEGIARALAVPASRELWAELLDVFLRWDDATALGAKGGLGAALSVAADDSVIDDVIALVRDEKQGDNRIFLLSVLARSKRPEARKVLEESTDDPSLRPEAQRLLKRLEKREAARKKVNPPARRQTRPS